jgi:hypothetical protein
VIFRVLWRRFFGALRRLQDADDQRLAGHPLQGGAGQSYYQDFFMTLLNLTVVNIAVAT